MCTITMDPLLRTKKKLEKKKRKIWCPSRATRLSEVAENVTWYLSVRLFSSSAINIDTHTQHSTVRVDLGQVTTTGKIGSVQTKSRNAYPQARLSFVPILDQPLQHLHVESDAYLPTPTTSRSYPAFEPRPLSLSESAVLFVGLAAGPVFFPLRTKKKIAAAARATRPRVVIAPIAPA